MDEKLYKLILFINIYLNEFRYFVSYKRFINISSCILVIKRKLSINL